ncbi:MAG: HAMP domain-containing sensor histidine kinase, partial [bacterium]|nr:HAMP domain-containing sensor histidine kinase [bacterium]
GGGSTFLYSLNINIPPYPIILFFFYPIVIAYAILKHKLFNAKLIATEFITFSLWIFTFIRAVISKGTDDNIISWVFFGLMVFVGLLLIRSVRKEVEAKEEIERLAKDLTVANERLKELDKLKSEFVSIASHQLRSPLTAIKGYASLIMDGSYGKVPETIREVINKMYQASQSLVVMVEDFLNVSRIEQGRMKFELELTDLEDVIKKVISEQSLSVERAGLKLTYSNDHQSPYMVVVDTGKIRQVITNLIDNAIKYTPKGSIAVCLSKNTKKGKIIISVADTGMGIDKETVPTLFAKFIRAKGANKVNVIGTGLGLYVVKEIVNGHHGRAWVESEGKGKGSTFFVELEEDYNTSHAIKVANFAKTM